MTREDALQKLKQSPYDKEKIHQDFEFVANKLDISIVELTSYFDLPKKTYKNYRNQEEIYKLGAKLMKILGLEVGGKR